MFDYVSVKSKIYINVHRIFLQVYKLFNKEEAVVVQKTDELKDEPSKYRREWKLYFGIYH